MHVLVMLLRRRRATWLHSQFDLISLIQLLFPFLFSLLVSCRCSYSYTKRCIEIKHHSHKLCRENLYLFVDSVHVHVHVCAYFGYKFQLIQPQTIFGTRQHTKISAAAEFGCLDGCLTGSCLLRREIGQEQLKRSKV